MIGRLGMTGASLTRGDSAVYKAMSKPLSTATKLQAAGGVGIVGAAGAGAVYSHTPAARERKKQRNTRNRIRHIVLSQMLADDDARRAGVSKASVDRVAQAAAQKAAAKAANRLKAQQARAGMSQTVAAAQAEVPKKKVPLKLLMPTNKQYANWTVDAAMVGGGSAAVHHHKVRKADSKNKNTVAGAVFGAGATDGVLNVGGWVNRESIKHHERKVDAGVLPHPTSRGQRKKILSDHKAKHGFSGDIHDAGNAYYRDFPSSMPAWKRKRMVGFKNHPGVVAGLLGAGTAAGAVAARRRSQPVAKAEKRDYSGAAVGSGAVVGTVGLAGGGIPGVKSNRIMVDVKGAKGVRAKAANLAGAYRGGEFGYRHNAHHTFKTFGMGEDAPKKATRVEHFTQGIKAGKGTAEDKIIRHLKVGRLASNAALVGGTALVGAGIHQRKKLVAKRRDDFKADAVAAGGATTALTAGGVSRVLDSQGRKWSRESAASHDAASKLVPKLGGYDVKATRTRVPDVVPHRSRNKNINQHKVVLAGRSNKVAEAAGALKGAAGQQRYFAATYGTMGGYARKIAAGGALVGAAGLGAKAANTKRHEVGKASVTMSDADAKKLSDKYDTRGPLPKTLSREQKMKAYEARYVSAGGKKAEKYKHRAAAAEVGRTAGLGVATASAAGVLATRGKRTGKIMAKLPLTHRHIEGAGLAGAAVGGSAEMYGAYARHRRASYANSPAGVAGSALTRMQNYTPRKPGAKT